PVAPVAPMPPTVAPTTAQTVAPPPTATAAPTPNAVLPPAAVVPEDPVAAGRAADAHLDHVLLLPTAETHPAGTVYLSDVEIIGLQAGYALSDRTQLTLTFIPAFFGAEPIVPLDLSLKGVFHRTPHVRLAAMASFTGLFGLNEGNAAIGRVG